MKLHHYVLFFLMGLIACSSSEKRNDPQELGLEVQLVDAYLTKYLEVPTSTGGLLQSKASENAHFLVVKCHYTNIAGELVTLPTGVLTVNDNEQWHWLEYQDYAFVQRNWAAPGKNKISLQALATREQFFVFELPQSLSGKAYFIPYYKKLEDFSSVEDEERDATVYYKLSIGLLTELD